MKKFLAIITMLFLISPIFAKTIVKFYRLDEFSVRESNNSARSMTDEGWEVESVSTISSESGVYVIVVYKKDDK